MIKLAKVLEGVKTVAIAGHVRPDGDCVGSCLGIFNYLAANYPQIEADVYLQEFSESFDFLAGVKQVKHQVDDQKSYDLFIAVDCSDEGRLADAALYLKTSKKTICIDHHISNIGYAQENYIVADASSTCELVFCCMEEENIDNSTAEALYLGIVHDTGVFQYSSTGQQTMEIAGKLMSHGIAFTNIIEETFYEKTYVQNQLLGRALTESELLLDGRCIFTAISKETLEFYHAQPHDLEGVVNQLRITKGVEVAIFLYEMEQNEYKVSLRSKEKVDVSRVAGTFEGGGHVRAAGCTIKGTVRDIIDRLTECIAQQL